MKVLVEPDQKTLEIALKRPQLKAEDLNELIAGVFEQVEKNGDTALCDYTQKFDGVLVDELRVTLVEQNRATEMLSVALKQAIQVAATNIERFHQTQVQVEPIVETTSGVTCWRKSVPIQTVGLYIPGGSAPLFSTVLMLGIPAKIAGSPRRILCTPPDKNGQINPAILYAASIAGITEIYKVGGAQAIAAMALGTETIPKVDKLFGPGNQYVTAAKQFALQKGIAIDLPAGPSEVMVVADDSVPATFIAADLLAQAEHGSDSQVVFLTNALTIVDEVQFELKRQLVYLSRAAVAQEALENSVAIILPNREWARVINQYAPEHLILMGKYEQETLDQVVNAGSVFLGNYTAESFGDYASGTNHTLPTAGFASAYSGVSVDSFVKKITYQRVEINGLLELGPTVVTLAQAESLDAHANAITVRMNSMNVTN